MKKIKKRMSEGREKDERKDQRVRFVRSFVWNFALFRVFDEEGLVTSNEGTALLIFQPKASASDLDAKAPSTLDNPQEGEDGKG